MPINDQNQIQQQSDNSANVNVSPVRGGGDPFSQTVDFFAGNNQNNQPNQNNNNMPDGMSQTPPSTDPNYQQFLAFQKQQQEQGVNSPANTQEQGGSPLDQFSPKVDNEDKDKGAKVEQPAPAKSIFDNDKAAYAKLVESTDFAGEVTQEMMTAILGGDIQILTNVINNAARGAFAAATFSSSQVAKSGIGTHMDNFQSQQLPGLLSDHSFQQGFQNNGDAVLNHPAVQPLVQQKTQDLRSQFPQASVNEIQEKVVEYFKAVGQAFNTTDNGQKGSSTLADAQDTGQSDLELLFAPVTK